MKIEFMETLVLENVKQKSTLKLSPVVKWPGGKEQELKCIIDNAPLYFDRYIEPFVGGGAVSFSINNQEKLINDKSKELINFYEDIKFLNYNLVKKLNTLNDSWVSIENFIRIEFENLNEIYSVYKLNSDTIFLSKEIHSLIEKNGKYFYSLLDEDVSDEYETFIKELNRNAISKLKRMAVLESAKGNLPTKDIYDNFECAFKSAFYMFIRHLYNQNFDKNSHYFYFIREYCYSSMFRYNSSGKFNVPYGGISYNRKNFKKKIDYIESPEIQEHFSKTKIYNLDFEDFFNSLNLKKNDFIFLDPPYDTIFSDYARLSFDKTDQVRLANYLINKCPSKFMLLIKKTDFIYDLYKNKGFNISTFDKKYMVSFKNRNNKDVEHLLITNY